MKKDLIAIVLLVLITSCFCYEIVIENRSPFRGDIAEQFYPWKVYVKDSVLNRGELPYWNPYTFGGAPLLANMQSAVFYPFDWALMLTFPMERFYGLSLWLHLCLAGIGAYLLSKKCGVDAFPAMLAGVAYGLNGFTMIHIPAGNHLTYAAAAWIPWLMWATVGYARTHTKKIKWALIGLVIAFLHFLCGHPQMAFYSLFFSGLFCAIYSIWLHYKIEGRPLFFSILRIFGWGMALVLGIFLAGFQLIPTLEYAELANRAAQLDLASATEYSFAPHRLITLLFPDYYGTMISGNHYDSFVFWSNAYAGVIVPCLAIYAMVKKPRESVVMPLIVIGVVGLLLAWGRGNPLYTLWFQLPGFGSFRAPAKYLPYYLTAVCVLASIGLNQLCNEAYKRLQEHPPKTSVVQRCTLLFACVLVVFIMGPQVFWQVTGSIREMDGVGEETYIRLFSAANGFMLMLAGFTLYLLARNIPKYPRLAVSASLVALVTMDLFVYGRGYLLSSNLLNETQMKVVSAVPQEIGFLQSQDNAGPYRVATLRDLYAPNQTIHWGVRNIAGYDPMSLKTYNQQIAKVEGWAADDYHDNIQLENFEHPVLDELNVKYILTPSVIGAGSLKSLYTGHDFKVYERTSNTISWARLGKKAKRGEMPTEWHPTNKIEVIEYTPHKIRFSNSFDEYEKIKLAEWYYPGWSARIYSESGANKAVGILPSDEGYRIVQTQAGWDVVMEYHPPVLGWVLSFFTLLIVIGLVVIDRLFQSGKFYAILQRAMGRNF